MRSSYVLNKHQYINTVVILVCNDLVILACLHFVNRLVAVIPGIQLLVSGVIVDAAMAGVTFWEEHHRTLIAAQGTGWHREKKVVCHVDTVCMYAGVYCACMCMCTSQPVNGVMDVIETLYGGTSSIACVVDHIKGATY